MNYLENPVFEEAYDYILANNKGGSNPYHNNKHMMQVFENAMMLFDMYRKEQGFRSKDRLELGLAALFHDFNHSAGKFKEYQNIELAIEGLRDFLSTQYDLEVDEENIIDILLATEFPHKKMELNYLQKIIRDADMLSSIGEKWFEPMVALASESNKSLTQYIPILINFVNSVKFYTPYCIDHLTVKRDKMLKDILKLQSELTSYL